MTHFSRTLVSLLALAACGDDHPAVVTPDAPIVAIDAPPPTPDAPEYTAEELAILVTLSPVPAVPADTTNAYADNAAAAQLGQMLFFDKSYSGPLVVGDDTTIAGLGHAGETGKVSCQSCHGVGSRALDDQRSAPNNVSLGTNYGTRNAHGLVNSSFYKWSNWGGRFDSQWSLPLAVAENPGIMKSSRLAVAHMLFDKYRTEYDAVFPVPLDAELADLNRFPAIGKTGDASWEGMAAGDREIVNRIFANYGKALAAYTRTLVSRDSAFDRYRAGDATAISDAAKRGIHTFLASCATCHSGSNFADDEFHALGVPQTGPNVPATDLGRFQDIPPLLASPFNSNSMYSDDVTTGRLDGLVQAEDQKNTFRTKSLRNVAMSAPYMHAGQFATLAEVVAFYSTGNATIAPLNLDAAAQADLVAFLETLTGEPLDAARLADTSK